MKAIVIGCGRVGSNVALQLQGSDWDVTVVDENEDALGRLGEAWTGRFVVGHGMDLQLLRDAGIEEADAVVVTTDGDNTNLVIAQAAQKLFEVPTVIVRVLDPARAQFFATKGLRVVCPTSSAIETLVGAVRRTEAAPAA
ncbi:MAG TPA: NAD-binding protein [Gaiellaceae bacterium]|nr:NAD-binding protein [Gaiellaceae bacterium]